MNTIKFHSPLFPGSQTWFFVCKALALEPQLVEVVTDNDTFAVHEQEPGIMVMSHNSAQFGERELFAFNRDDHIEASVMHRVLVHTLKNAYVEYLI